MPIENEDRPRQERLANHSQHASASSHPQHPPLNAARTSSKLEDYLERKDRLEGLFNGQNDGHPPGIEAMTDHLQTWDDEWSRLSRDMIHEHDKDKKRS